MTHEQIEQYLSRIGIDHAERPSADFLARLHYAHLQNVPYENLDILAGIPLSLAVPDLFDKIVLRRRGGFCFELNRLFGELLRDLGFVVTDYVARYWGGGDGTVPKRRHHVLRAGTSDGEFLCDVGVGARIPLYPVPYESGRVSEQCGMAYMLRDDDLFGKMLMERHGDGWRNLYSFTEEIQFACDYQFACFWCERAPDSIFNKRYMLSIRHGSTRHTFDGPVYKVFSDSGVAVSTPDEAERTRIFADVFGLTC